jgi:hypothetical protein
LPPCSAIRGLSSPTRKWPNGSGQSSRWLNEGFVLIGM